MSCGAFASNKSFAMWMEDYGLPATLCIYAAVSVVTAVGVMYTTKETKGQSIDVAD